MTASALQSPDELEIKLLIQKNKNCHLKHQRRNRGFLFDCLPHGSHGRRRQCACESPDRQLPGDDYQDVFLQKEPCCHCGAASVQSAEVGELLGFGFKPFDWNRLSFSC